VLWSETRSSKPLKEEKERARKETRRTLQEPAMAKAQMTRDLSASTVKSLAICKEIALSLEDPKETEAKEAKETERREDNGQTKHNGTALTHSHRKGSGQIITVGERVKVTEKVKMESTAWQKIQHNRDPG